MTNSSNDPPDLPPGVHDLDDLGHRAGAALREPSSLDGPKAAMKRGRQIRTRRLLVSSVAVGVVALGGFALLSRDDGPGGEQQAPVAGQPVPTTVAATTAPNPPSTTTAPATTTTTTTTTVVVVPGSEIAAAGILPPSSFGESFADSTFPVWTFSAEFAATVPSCAKFLDGFFESPDRPVDSDAHQYVTATGGQAGMYVQVLPTEADAIAVMASVEDSGFPTCWTDFFSRSVVVRPNGIAAADYVGAADPQVVLAGDQPVAIRIEGSLTTDSGFTFPDVAVSPIVRVGRAIFTFNFAEQDLPTDQVIERVQEIVDRLRAAQA